MEFPTCIGEASIEVAVIETLKFLLDAASILLDPSFVAKACAWDDDTLAFAVGGTPSRGKRESLDNKLDDIDADEYP